MKRARLGKIESFIERTSYLSVDIQEHLTSIDDVELYAILKAFESAINDLSLAVREIKDELNRFFEP